NERRQGLNRQQRSKRPEQQIYRPGQLRQSKVCKSGERSGDIGRDDDDSLAGADAWVGGELQVNSTDEDKGNGSRESSGDITYDDINQRLDNLYIESPPREIDSKTKRDTNDTLSAHDDDGVCSTSTHSPDDKSWTADREKDGGKRRGKRPDIKIYVPRARLGDREKKSEEKDDVFESASPSRSNDCRDKGFDKMLPEQLDEIVVSDSADSLRKVQVKTKGGAMKVTVMNESLTSGGENSPTLPRKELGPVRGKNYQKPVQNTRASPGPDANLKQKNKDFDNKAIVPPRGTEKFSRQFESSKKGKGKHEFGHNEVTVSQDIRKNFPQKVERSVKSLNKNRRSNSSDSRPKDHGKSEANSCQSDKGQFSSETFPRTKVPNNKSSKTGGKDTFTQSKNGKDTYGTNKGPVREGEKFYWGMRRQRTGSISSEASIASNPSNGSFYSGSSDFTEDDEPEHILNWGEEVEKAHLEELARLVHDGAKKLTNSLDSYPGFGPTEGNAGTEKKIEVPSTLDRQKSVSADEIYHGKAKEGGRTRHRRHRHRKNSSRQGSRDSSVHSSIHGEDGFSERGHRRRRRQRRNSQGSQGGYEHHHNRLQQKQQQQQHEDRHYAESGGDSGRNNRSGLQVTIGDHNRHVEISRSGGPRQRHRSDEKWDPNNVRDYDVEEGEEDWERNYDYGEDREFKRDDRHGQQKWEKEHPPRFKREGVGAGRSRRGSVRDEIQRQQSGREKEERNRHEEHGNNEERGELKQEKDFDQRHSGDQRAVHPAHDASAGGRSCQRGGRGQGRNVNKAKSRRRDERDENCNQHEQRHPIQRAGSLNHEDTAASQKARGGGLLRLPSQPEPPRPHSNPSPASHADHAFHHHADNFGGGGPSSSAQGSNTRGPAQGKRHLFDPKNPSKPIMVPDAAPRFEDTDKGSSPGAVSGHIPSSPDSPQTLPYPQVFYPTEFMHPMYRFRPPMAPFPPFMGGYPPGSIPPHVFYRFPRMTPPDMGFYNSPAEMDSEGLMSSSSRAQCRMMAEQILRDSVPFESQLGNILSRRPNSEDSFRMVNQIRAELQNRLEQVMLMDIEVANKHNVEQTLWKSVYYQVIESHRKRIVEDSKDFVSKQRLIDVLDEGTRFFENVLKKLQSTFGFDLEVFSDGNKPVPENVGRNVKFALLSAQRVMMFLGDISRYKEQASDTTNYGKARHWYLKAQRIHPRNGRPYNQLAILAVYTRRKLDAVYYYMRSLAASNPILTARESLMSLFDEVRRKVDAAEKKRFEDRRRRMALRRKPQIRGPRVEIWVQPDGTSTQDRVEEGEEDDDLSSLSVFELNKRFVLTYLNVHGKLFTKINFEMFAESSSLMLQEYQILIQHSPCVFSSTRLLQLMVINMFSVDNTALKDESLEEQCRSVLQEHAVEIGLEMFGLLVRRSCELLTAQIEAQNSRKKGSDGGTIWETNGSNCHYKKSSENPLPPKKASLSRADSYVPLDEDLHLMLPALKTWVDWMMCHPHLWNPQPLNRPPDLGPQIDVWKNLATFCDLLNAVDTKQGCLIREQKEGYEPVILHEDTTLAGFVPMLSAPQEVFYADSTIDKEIAEDWLRIEKLRLFGEYLCGVEPPLLAYNVESGKYYSVAPSPTRSEEKLVGDEARDSGEDSDDVIIEHDDSDGDSTKDNKEKNDIELLKAKKAELNRQREEREKNKENMEAILDSHRHAKIELEICPIFLIPDTNCFIDHFSTLKKILQTKKYTLVVPLVVINELDGLTRGARDKQYDSPDHAHKVKTQAQAAIEFLEAEFEVKNPNLRAQTAKGSILETIAFR
ncbi:unnamed protein product, partial [Lymnaea stagnalis]